MGAVDDRTELYPIGWLARRTGLPVRTIRYWSDLGLVPPAGRSASGYRCYRADAVARLDLVRTLRELGLGLEVVRRVLDGETTVAEVAGAHVRALDAQIRILRHQRAVLRSVATRGTSIEEMAVTHELASLSARERQRIIDDFVDRAFAGVDPGQPGTRIAEGMRQLPAELPDDPTAEQVDAWVELATLVSDPDFATRVREMVVAGAAEPDPDDDLPAPDPGVVAENAGGAIDAGVPPDSAEGKAVLDRIVPPDTPAEHRVRLRENLETFTDARVERYWRLIGTLNGWRPRPSAAPAFEWLIAALRAHG